MTTEYLQQTANWLAELNRLHGHDGVIHEVAAVLSENHNFSISNRRYRSLLAETAVVCGNLYEETGHEKLLDCERSLRQMIQFADNGTLPTQLELFAMPTTL